MSAQTAEKILFVTNRKRDFESLKKIVELKNITEVATDSLEVAFEMIKQRVRGTTIITEKYKISVTEVIDYNMEDFVIISDMILSTENKARVATPELLNFLCKEKVIIELSSIDNINNDKVMEFDTFCILRTEIDYDIEHEEYKYTLEDLIVFKGRIEKLY